MLWPRGIYLEASVLYALPLGVVNAQMERLLEISRVAEIPIFITDVSFQEWVAKRRDNVKNYIDKTESSLNRLSGLFDYISKINWKKTKEDIINDTEASIKKILDQNGIRIIETPDMDIKEMIRMAVCKKKPFEERHEKGFRDYVNLRTILEHARSQPEGPHFLVAQDEIYQDRDITKLAEQYHIKLVIPPSIERAISILEEFFRTMKKTIDEYKKQPLKQYLMKETDKISQYTYQNAEISESFLNQNHELGFLPKIQAIENVKLISIVDVTRGILPKNNRQSRIKISFRAKMKFTVKIRDIPTPPQMRFKDGRKISSPEAFYFALALGDETRRTPRKSVDRTVSLEGSIMFTRRKDKKEEFVDTYTDLNLDNVATE